MGILHGKLPVGRCINSHTTSECVYMYMCIYMFTCVYLCLHIYMSDDLELKSHLSDIPIRNREDTNQDSSRQVRLLGSF